MRDLRWKMWKSMRIAVMFILTNVSEKNSCSHMFCHFHVLFLIVMFLFQHVLFQVMGFCIKVWQASETKIQCVVTLERDIFTQTI